MASPIRSYSVIPNAERVGQSKRDEFIRGIKEGRVDESGYCPRRPGNSAEVRYGSPVGERVKIVGYEKLPDSRWAGKYNPVFQKIVYEMPDGTRGGMVVHIDTVRRNPKIAGSAGLLIEDAVLVEKATKK